MTAERARVHFRLTQDADGYPPVGVETLWARRGEQANEYVIDNVPFFVCEATLGDLIAIIEEDGQRWFFKLLDSAGHSLIRIVFFDDTCVQEISDQLRSLGCWTEYEATHKLLAVDMPTRASLAQAQSLLRREAATGRIDYEEAILRE